MSDTSTTTSTRTRTTPAGAVIDCGCGWGSLCDGWTLTTLLASAPLDIWGTGAYLTGVERFSSPVCDGPS